MGKAEFINLMSEVDLENLPEPKLVGTSLSFDLKDFLQEKVKERMPVAPSVIISDEAYDKMFAIVDECAVELAWHGVVEKVDQNYIITDILVYPQEIAATTVDAIEDKYGDWLLALEDDVFNNLRMQGHSHVNMGITPSSVDETYYKELLAQVEDYYIVLIVNKSRKAMVRLYDIANNLIVSDLELQKQSSVDNSSWAKEQLKTYTVKKTYTPASTFKPNYGHYTTFESSYNKKHNIIADDEDLGSKKEKTKKEKSKKNGPYEILKEGNAIYINEMYGTLSSIRVSGSVLLGYCIDGYFESKNDSNMHIFDFSTNIDSFYANATQLLMPERNVSMFMAAMIENTFNMASAERFRTNVAKFDAIFEKDKLVNGLQFSAYTKDPVFSNTIGDLYVSDLQIELVAAGNPEHIKYIAVGGAV